MLQGRVPGGTSKWRVKRLWVVVLMAVGCRGVEGAVADHGVQGQDAAVGQDEDGLAQDALPGFVCTGSRPGRWGWSVESHGDVHAYVMSHRQGPDDGGLVHHQPVPVVDQLVVEGAQTGLIVGKVTDTVVLMDNGGLVFIEIESVQKEKTGTLRVAPHIELTWRVVDES